jgi:hypothetical protein
VAGPFDLTDASSATLTLKSQWDFFTGDHGDLIVSNALATPTSACNTATQWFLFTPSFVSGTSPNFGVSYEPLTEDLQPLVGTIRCIGFRSFDDGTGDANTASGWFIDDVRVSKQ